MASVLLLTASFVVETLLASLAYKLFRWGEFVAAAEAYTLVSWLPVKLRHGVRVLVPCTEAAVLAAILLPRTREAGVFAAALLLLVLTAAVALDRRPTLLGCGCWGSAPAGVQRGDLILRNTVLVAVAAVAAAAAAMTTPAFGTLAGAQAACLVAPFVLLTLELPTLLPVALHEFSMREA